MDETLSYDYIWKICQEEKQTNVLLPISRDFYDSAVKLINNSATGENEKANLTKILLDLFERRKQKILLYIAYGKQLPTQIDNRELAFCDSIMKTVKAEKLNISEDKHNKVLLRILKDIPEIILPSGNKAGPLVKDEVIEVETINEDVKFLISNAICEKYNR
ncbi:MAG: hypothetical protein QXR73_02200 [Candidatus Micrarchaeaceae archaeon]